MKTLLSTICAIFISLSIYGQTDFFKFKTISSEDCNFPIFTSSVDTLTYNKINQTLQLLKLNLLEGFQTKTIFEEIRFTDFEPKAAISRQMEFEILENNNKTLTIYFNEASCYATCFYWNSYLNFNSQNGNLINIEEFFTKEGFENFKQIVKNKNIKHIINQSLSIEKEYRTSFINAYSNLISNADINDFYIKHDTIVIDRWNFLDKNTKVSGMNLITKYSISEFKNHLNEYGNYIFSTINVRQKSDLAKHII